MTSIRFRLFATAATLAAWSLIAHADTFSGSGRFRTSDTGSGDFLITGITGGGVKGVIAPSGFHGNNKLLFPSSKPLLDPQGFSFAAAEGSDQFDFNVFNDVTGYFAYFRDQDAFTDTLPISFKVAAAISAVPEPPTLFLIGTGLVGAAGVVRKVSRLRLRKAVYKRYRRLREALGLALFLQNKSDVSRSKSSISVHDMPTDQGRGSLSRKGSPS